MDLYEADQMTNVELRDAMGWGNDSHETVVVVLMAVLKKFDELTRRVARLEAPAPASPAADDDDPLDVDDVPAGGLGVDLVIDRLERDFKAQGTRAIAVAVGVLMDKLAIAHATIGVTRVELGLDLRPQFDDEGEGGDL